MKKDDRHYPKIIVTKKKMEECKKNFPETAEISYLPVCTNCKNIIFDVIDIEYPNEYYYEDGSGRHRLIQEFEIKPHKCKHCGRVFTSIQIPTKLPFDNRQRSI